MAASVNNYFIGKGIVSFKPSGGVYRDLGNVPLFEFTPANEELEHYSSREGVKTLDKVVSTSVKGTVKISMEEYVLENMAIAVLGSDPVGNSIDILAESSITGSLKCVGTNDVGKKFEIELLLVTFKAGSTISFIGDDWGAMEVEGSCQAVAGAFGTIEDITGT